MPVTGSNYGAHDFVHQPDSHWGKGMVGGHVHVCAECEATYINSGDGPCYACRPAEDA